MCNHFKFCRRRPGHAAFWPSQLPEIIPGWCQPTVFVIVFVIVFVFVIVSLARYYMRTTLNSVGDIQGPRQAAFWPSPLPEVISSQLVPDQLLEYKLLCAPSSGKAEEN